MELLANSSSLNVPRANYGPMDSGNSAAGGDGGGGAASNSSDFVSFIFESSRHVQFIREAMVTNYEYVLHFIGSETIQVRFDFPIA